MFFEVNLTIKCCSIFTDNKHTVYYYTDTFLFDTKSFLYSWANIHKNIMRCTPNNSL